MIKHKELILFYFKQNELNFFKYYYTYIKYFIIKRLINKIQLKILLLKWLNLLLIYLKEKRKNIILNT